MGTAISVTVNLDDFRTTSQAQDALSELVATYPGAVKFLNKYLSAVWTRALWSELNDFLIYEAPDVLQECMGK